MLDESQQFSGTEIERLPLFWRRLDKEDYIWMHDWPTQGNTEGKPFQTNGYLCASAPHGGIVVTYKVISKPGRFSRHLNVYNAALEFLNQIDLRPPGYRGRRNRDNASPCKSAYNLAPVSFIGVTKEEIIVVILMNCSVLLFNRIGVFIACSKPAFIQDGDREVKIATQPRMVRMHGNTICMTVTSAETFFVMEDLHRPKWLVYSSASEHDNSVNGAPGGSLSSGTVRFDFLMKDTIDSLIIFTVNMMGELAIHSDGNVLVMYFPKDLVREGEEVSVLRLTVQPSPKESGRIAVLVGTEKGMGVVFMDIARLKITDLVVIDTSEGSASESRAFFKTDVIAFEWCGDSAVALIYKEYLMLVCDNGRVMYVDNLFAPIISVPEVDGLRIIYAKDKVARHLLIMRVAKEVIDLVKDGKAKGYIKSYVSWMQGVATEDITSDPDSAEVVKKIIVAAKKVCVRNVQSLLINTAWYVSSFLNYSQRENIGHRKIAQKLRIINTLDSQDRRIYITFAQMKEAGIDAIVARLCNRGDHALAVEISDQMGCVMGAVENHFALTRVVMATQNAEYKRDDMRRILALIRNGLALRFNRRVALDYAAIAKMLIHTMGVEYFAKSEGDGAANEAMFRDIVIELIEMEGIPSRTIPIRLLLREYKDAMETASNMGDGILSGEVSQYAINKNEGKKLSELLGSGSISSSSLIYECEVDMLDFRLDILNVDGVIGYLFFLFGTTSPVYLEKPFATLVRRLTKFGELFYLTCGNRHKEFVAIVEKARTELAQRPLLNGHSDEDERERETGADDEREEGEEDNDDEEEEEEEFVVAKKKRGKSKGKKSGEDTKKDKKKKKKKVVIDIADCSMQDDDSHIWCAPIGVGRRPGLVSIHDELCRLLDNDQRDEAERLRISLGIPETRFIWIAVNFYIRTGKKKAFMEQRMRDDVKKINGLVVFNKCAAENWVDAAAGLIKSITNAKDQAVARESMQQLSTRESTLVSRTPTA